MSDYDPVMARMSNRDRIAQAAEEARLAEAEKLARKAAAPTPKKKAAKRASKPKPKEVRMKIVWEVCNINGRPVKNFSYPDKAAAENEAARLTASSGHRHELRATKVPMD